MPLAAFRLGGSLPQAELPPGPAGPQLLRCVTLAGSWPHVGWVHLVVKKTWPWGLPRVSENPKVKISIRKRASGTNASRDGSFVCQVGILTRSE